MSGAAGETRGKHSMEDFKAVDLTKLHIGQLEHLKQTIDQELALFQNSIHSLKIAQTKFQESKECLEKIPPDSEGKSMMVPLTGSIYVPGTVAEPNKVLIDIGTGYYVQMSVESGIDYFSRKVAFVTEQITKVQALGIERSKEREVILEVMEMKADQDNVQPALKANSMLKS